MHKINWSDKNSSHHKLLKLKTFFPFSLVIVVKYQYILFWLISIKCILFFTVYLISYVQFQPDQYFLCVSVYVYVCVHIQYHYHNHSHLVSVLCINIDWMLWQDPMGQRTMSCFSVIILYDFYGWMIF